MKQTASEILALDRVLARYGSKTVEIRKVCSARLEPDRHDLVTGLIQAG
jgi:hypothetical protein